MKPALYAGLLLCLTSPAVRPACAQENIKIGGLAYVDYAYVLGSPNEDQEGDNGFGYRRLYLTTDFKISDDFSGRARLEASDESTTAQGNPAPYIKDLYLTWSNVLGEGHNLIVGVSPPPAFEVSENFLGYRSLEKTIMDRDKIVSSRDFGVALKGRLTSDGSIRYGIMAANNSSVKRENDRNKRVYGQLEWYPTGQLSFTLGGDYASYSDERSDGVNINAFAGYKTDRFRVGAEGFFNRFNLDGAAVRQAAVQAEDTNDLAGVSLFAAARLAETWELVVRFDQLERDLQGSESSERFFLAGLAFAPHPRVRFIPNVLLSKESEDAAALVTGRITLHMDF